MTPKVKFKYSRVYDAQWRDLFAKLPGRQFPYPSPKVMSNRLVKFEKAWRKIEQKVLSELSKVTGLKWQKQIECYVVGKKGGFSEPLTIPLKKQPNWSIDVLVHELIHVLFTQNSSITHPYWLYMRKKFKATPLSFTGHIPVHAIHQHIYLKLFTKKRLDDDIAECQKFEAYKKAWDYVLANGYMNIITEFKSKYARER